MYFCWLLRTSLGTSSTALRSSWSLVRWRNSTDGLMRRRCTVQLWQTVPDLQNPRVPKVQGRKQRQIRLNKNTKLRKQSHNLLYCLKDWSWVWWRWLRMRNCWNQQCHFQSLSKTRLVTICLTLFLALFQKFEVLRISFNVLLLASHASMVNSKPTELTWMHGPPFLGWHGKHLWDRPIGSRGGIHMHRLDWVWVGCPDLFKSSCLWFSWCCIWCRSRKIFINIYVYTYTHVSCYVLGHLSPDLTYYLTYALLFWIITSFMSLFVYCVVLFYGQLSVIPFQLFHIGCFDWSWSKSKLIKPCFVPHGIVGAQWGTKRASWAKAFWLLSWWSAWCDCGALWFSFTNAHGCSNGRCLTVKSFCPGTLCTQLMLTPLSSGFPFTDHEPTQPSYVMIGIWHVGYLGLFKVSLFFTWFTWSIHRLGMVHLSGTLT